MHPDQERDRAGEVEGDVEDAEDPRQPRDCEGGVLDAPLPEDPERALERDDVGGVQPCGSPVLPTEPAHELVGAVERYRRRRLDATGTNPYDIPHHHGPDAIPPEQPRGFGFPHSGGRGGPPLRAALDWISGGVPERSNGAVLKTVGRASVPWVRIPPPPLKAWPQRTRGELGSLSGGVHAQPRLVDEAVYELARRERFADQVALGDVAAEVGEVVPLLGGLDAFGDDGGAECVGELDG